ncbi:hypothetical protein [Paractinoplanes rishiriensis]|uniref:Uncharacterized protein n=1 Tax=Paractinoplanes rishiriensis TaxID=1050105 RepID=A0A919K2T7_9ACTN|nr:hypothetical protein [Actinoplanes rishiriensis]GIE99675.1 hypothetical protein Ari01nite_71400 [Actinoplanes rishiriensis]
MRVVIVPAPFVATGWGIPTVCVRHGEPAAAQPPVTFRTLVPGGTVLMVIAPLIMMIVVLATEKRVVSPAWPLCARCLRLRALRRAVTATLLGLAGGLVVVAFAALESWGSTVAVAVLVLVAGLWALSRSTTGRIANGYVDSSGQTLEFRRPHAGFVTLVAAAKQHAGSLPATR